MRSSTVTLGGFLRGAREDKALSLRSVEQRTGVSNAYLSQLENGRIQQPSPVILHKLCELYEISYEQVMAKAGYPMPDASDSAEIARPMGRFGNVTAEEEQELAQYLEFIRARNKKGSRR